MLNTARNVSEMKSRFPSGRTYTVGLLGAGTVGGGLIRLIGENLAHHLLPVEISRVGVRNLSKSRGFSLPASLLSDDLESIVSDPSIDILVEVMGGLEPARTYITKALMLGKHVITANKYVVSESGDYLQRLADSKGRHFLYEASVAGSIPIVEILNERVIPDRINAIYAILNSTTNFILTQMGESRQDYHAALAKAQELGFSEPDPNFDISGKDASQKLSILVSILKHHHCHAAQINVRGIEFLTLHDFQFAAKRQQVIKPLAIYEESDGIGFASVEPVLIPKHSVFANTRNEYNALCFDCLNIGKQIFIGKGAGELPTASAVLSDLRKITEQQDYEPLGQWSRSREAARSSFRNSVENPRLCRFYIRCSTKRSPVVQKSIRDCLTSLGEIVPEEQAEVTEERLTALTHQITHSDLYRTLSSVLTFDPDVQIAWLRILQDF